MSGTDGDLSDDVSGALDEARPNPARMYDYALGGAANFQVDRDAAREVLKRDPEGMVHARANRAFLRRVVRELVGRGVRQFIDLGSGVPTVGHVHEVAQRVDPGVRVVYVDNEPVAAAYSRKLLVGVAGTAVVQMDLREVRRVLDHPETRRLISLDEPVAVLMFAVLHFMLDDTAVEEVIAGYLDATVPGSYLAVSHACAPGRPASREIEELYRTSTTMPFRYRNVAEVRDLFAGYELLEPGVVPVPDWRPDPGPDPHRPSVDVLVGGVGRHR
jgi:S-adenosyl methyltransferase